MKRSRNGCNECRRLHRRCDESKPECQGCKGSGKPCSYNRTLSWGGRPFGKSPFRTALEGGVGEILTGTSFTDERKITHLPLASCGKLNAHLAPAKSFVYGPVPAAKVSGRSHSQVDLKRTRSEFGGASTQHPSGWSTPVGTPAPAIEIPWLSDHHRMLFNFFTEKTILIFHSNKIIQAEIKSIMIPMAADTNHGFSLLAAILSLTSTQRLNLGLHQDQAEIDYWRDMSFGHLRRPGVQE